MVSVKNMYERNGAARRRFFLRYIGAASDAGQQTRTFSKNDVYMPKNVKILS